jgi:integrase/recombinase XerD
VGILFANYLNEYLQHEKVVHNKSANTLKAYKNDISQLLEFFTKEGIKEISMIKEIHLRTFLMEIKKNNISKRSINRKISAIKSFYAFLENHDYIVSNIAEKLENSFYQNHIPQILSKEDIEKIRTVLCGNKMNDYRDRLIIELLYSSGIRANELLNLSEGLFNLEDRELKVISKNKSERIVFFSKTTAYYFEKYVEAKKKKFGEDYKKNILFVNNSQTRLSDRSLRRIIDRIIKKTDINKEVSPHTLRHSFGAYMLQHGMNLHYLQELMGHTSIESTKLYLEYDIHDVVVEDKSYYNKTD